MKDEELAEKEYENCKFEKVEHYCDKTIFIAGFLAGLKVGRPQWHDLRKDPTDLPKKNKSYWVYIDCQGNKIYRSIVWQGCWLGWNCVALAWCEEPQFEE